MKAAYKSVKLSRLPDVKLLGRVLALQNICLAAAGIISAVILLAWLIPALGSLLPEGWSLMNAETAFCFLLSAAGLFLTGLKRKNKLFVTGSSFGVIAIIVAGTALAGHMNGQAFAFDKMLATDTRSGISGMMPVQTAVFFILMGLLIIFTWTRGKKVNILADTSAILIIMLVMIAGSGFFFSTTNMFGDSDYMYTSPQALTCMILLMFSSQVSRMHNGVFSMLIGIGIGSQIVRLILPWLLLFPFVIISASTYLLGYGWLSLPYSAGLAASMTSILLFVVVLLMSGKINNLENDLHNLSLTDELTGIRNRRGFYLIGEHMFLDSKRNGTPLDILFFDLDNLKIVNDTFGHSTGSQLLLDFATLLRKNFRQNNVIGRLGGDEFAVLSGHGNLGIPLNRLQNAANALNSSGKKPYSISFSVGEVSEEPGMNDSFAKFVDRADAVMYEHKRRKKTSQSAAYSA